MNIQKMLATYRYPIILTLLVIVGFIFLSHTALLRHWSIGSYHFDLGNMHQAVYNTSQGRFLEVTDPNQFHQSNRLAYHFDPIMAIFAPLYWIYDGAEVLIVMQALILALGAVPVYLIARRILGKNTEEGAQSKSKADTQHRLWPEVFGLTFAAVYLLYYPMHNTAIFDYHSVTLATTFMLWMFYCGLVQKYRWSWVFIVLGWLSKENVPLVTAMFGAYTFYIGRVRDNPKAKKFGAWVFGMSLVVFFLLIQVVIPAFRMEGSHLASSYFSTSISENLNMLFRPQSLGYIIDVLGPVAFTPLFAPLQLAISAPEWLIILLSRNGNLRDLQYHYTALLTPFVIIASVYGVRNLANILTRYFKDTKDKKLLRPVIAEVVLVVVFLYGFFNSPILLSEYHVAEKRLEVIREWQTKLDEDSISVSTSGHLSPYFADRQYFYNFLYDFAYHAQGYSDEDIAALADHYTKADYVLIQESEMHNQEMIQLYYTHLLKNPNYEKVADDQGIEVYKKRAE